MGQAFQCAALRLPRPGCKLPFAPCFKTRTQIRTRTGGCYDPAGRTSVHRLYDKDMSARPGKSGALSTSPVRCLYARKPAHGGRAEVRQRLKTNIDKPVKRQSTGLNGSGGQQTNR